MTRAAGVAADRAAGTARLDHFLQTTSRTFALTIPLLGEPNRREVTVAYLLFRVADSLEDSTLWPRDRKLAELDRLARFVEAPREEESAGMARDWAADPPLAHPGYVELLSELPVVTRAAAELEPAAWRIVAAHTARTCRAMAAFVAREEDGALRLLDLPDLQAYCYAVAGIVGEMLTELFLRADGRLEECGRAMRQDAAAFGEALQLVNIIKDRETDAAEGRHYLPAAVPPETVIDRARRDLGIASRYCGRLEAAGADRGLVGFTALPILLARATLERVERLGAGAKLRRDEVASIVVRLDQALERRAVAALLQAA